MLEYKRIAQSDTKFHFASLSLIYDYLLKSP